MTDEKRAPAMPGTDIGRWLDASDREVGPACMNVPVPQTIATDPAFRDAYSQGYRHCLADVRLAKGGHSSRNTVSDAAAATQFLDDVFGSERAIEGDHAALVALLAGTRRETIEACAGLLDERLLKHDCLDQEFRTLFRMRDAMRAGQFTRDPQEKKT